MLVLGGKSKDGHILHMIVGPESEFHMDVHGVSFMDITPLLLAMNGTGQVQLSFTRCKSELVTSKCMQATGIPHLNSFQVAEEPEAEQKPGRKQKKVEKDPGAITPSIQVGRCSYCGVADQELLRIPGVKICGPCAQIELGRRREDAANKVADEESP